ncbi:YdbH domain-containing protein [Aliiglaciecola sp. CAU 1673]|uniref:YdbH domain-containing protein n=1 Tax=Aliiglaciecola sp. CAU 1673 TaxID=3032595 RepID=UPI0023DA25D4|nr:YdbH domain-containing protein [Aliiglaciecola sp. CAU 1673]MDF2178183.1 YdbH domain-containing protein [Aliiglaciecola sp. CAU 1673]
MARPVKWTVFFLLFTLVSAAIAWNQRVPLLRAWGNAYLKEQGYRIGCLSIELAWPLTLKLPRLCLISDSLDVQAEDLVYVPGDNQLSINKLAINHKRSLVYIPSEQSNNNAWQWQLPAVLPSVRIADLHIDSFWLKNPLQLKLALDSNLLNIEGDWQAELQLSDGRAQGELDWQPALLQDSLNLPMTLPDWLAQSHIISRFDLDGPRIYTRHKVNISGPLNLSLSDKEQCNTYLVAHGEFGLSLDIVMQSAIIDFSQLPLTFQALSCDGIAKEYIPEQLNLVFQRDINLTPHLISTSLVEINDAALWQGKLFLNNVQLLQGSELSLDYQLSLNHKTYGQLQSEGRVDWHPDGYLLQGMDNRFSLARFIDADLTLQTLQSQFTFQMEQVQGLQLDAELIIGNVSHKNLVLEALSSQISVVSKDLKRFILNHQSKVAKAVSGDIQLNTIQHKGQVDGDISGKLQISGQTELASADIPSVNLQGIKISHKGTVQSSSALKFGHQVMLPSGLTFDVAQNSRQLALTLPVQSALRLNNIIARTWPQAKLTGGNLAAYVEYTLSNDSLNGHIKLDNLAMQYGDYKLTGVSLAPQFTFSSDSLQVMPDKINIKHADTGIELNEIVATFASLNGELLLSDIRGNVFDGQFLLDNVVLKPEPQKVMLTLENLDSAKILALQAQSGIDVQGRIEGSLPLTISASGALIDKGKVKNSGPGYLRIQNNAAFESLKASQPQMDSALGLLQDLQFSQLTGDVSLAEDGWLDLAMNIKGRNPTKKQDINFNYTHQENILTLLKALRLGESVKQKVQQGIK